MSNILNDLGVEENDFKWFDIAICRGMDTNLFFDKYESDPVIAASIDALVNEGDFRIRRALKRESVRSVLSEVLALSGPDAPPVVEGVTGGLKIPAQIVYGPVVGVLQRQDVGFLLHEGEGFHSIGVH